MNDICKLTIHRKRPTAVSRMINYSAVSVCSFVYGSSSGGTGTALG